MGWIFLIMIVVGIIIYNVAPMFLAHRERMAQLKQRNNDKQ